jgi:PAS domain S-box-containing protein
MLPRALQSSEHEPLVLPMSPASSQVAQQAESRYQALLDAESTGVYTCDSGGVITYYNNQAAELWGRKPALGDTDEKFCGSHMMYRVDGSYLPHDQCPMADVLTGKISGVFDGEVHVQRPDGSRVVVIVNIAPLVDDGGVIVGAVNSFCENPLRKAVNGAGK